jgi:hypothetical protein
MTRFWSDCLTALSAPGLYLGVNGGYGWATATGDGSQGIDAWTKTTAAQPNRRAAHLRLKTPANQRRSWLAAFRV